MIKKPLLSVRLMVYNNEPFIRKTFESVLNQRTDFEFEIVVGDDFSTDKTLEIIKLYKNTENINIRILDRPVGGDYWLKRKEKNASVRTNFFDIVENCQGKYIALLDGDDYWTDPLKLQKQVNFLEANEDFAGVFHNTAYIDERQPNPVPKPWRTYPKDVFTAQDTIRKLSLFHTSSYCFRNLKYDYSLITNPKISSGDMMLLGLISKHGKLKLLDETMSVYRKNEGSITSSESQINYHQNRIALNQALNTYFDKQFDNQAQKIISYHEDQRLKLKYPLGYKLWKKIKTKLN